MFVCGYSLYCRTCFYNSRNFLYGKIYKMIKLYKNDCLIEMKNISDKSIDLILCDLPYEQTARNKWDLKLPFAPLWAEYKRIIKDNGAIILFANGMFTAELMMSNRNMWRYNLVWEKTQPTGFLNAKRMPLRNHEDICVFYKKLPVYNPQKTAGHKRKVSSASSKTKYKKSYDYNDVSRTSYDSTERYPKSVLCFPKDVQKTALHPTQKPVALLEYIIKSYSNEDDVVLDNCMGSGSTGVACLNTGRNFIGIEKDSLFFETARKRIRQAEKICKEKFGRTR